MASALMRPLARVARGSMIPRAICTSSVTCKDPLPAQIYPDKREHFYPRLGKREIVGFGQNGGAYYDDVREFPCPAIRFKEDDNEIAALREKEKGDWNLLSVEDKRKLYRAEFCRTYAEFTAPTGAWKSVAAITLAMGTATGLFVLFMHKYVLLPCRTSTPEWGADTIRKNVAEMSNWRRGEAYYYDYEKQKWK